MSVDGDRPPVEDPWAPTPGQPGGADAQDAPAHGPADGNPGPGTGDDERWTRAVAAGSALVAALCVLAPLLPLWTAESVDDSAGYSSRETVTGWSSRLEYGSAGGSQVLTYPSLPYALLVLVAALALTLGAIGLLSGYRRSVAGHAVVAGAATTVVGALAVVLGWRTGAAFLAEQQRLQPVTLESSSRLGPGGWLLLLAAAGAVLTAAAVVVPIARADPGRRPGAADAQPDDPRPDDPRPDDAEPDDGRRGGGGVAAVVREQPRPYPSAGDYRRPAPG